ncbi:olfactory receptor 51B5-like [Amia ocellicauda]|uniref:olfactory receptor 51B5-like n=1 Tax=Amia ocellicauda TaxID=2972642 RepID=UPI003463972F
MENSSYVFTLSGLNNIRGNKDTYFSLTLLAYLLIIFVNCTLIVTILREKSLHEPMYILLCNLCVNGLYGTAGLYPKLLADLLSDTHVIPYTACFLQVFVIYSSVLCDFSTLTVMAYDRYVAICRPLQYHSVITTQAVGKLILFSWLFPFFCILVLISLTARLTLCGSHIEKLYCENWAIVRLSCVPTTTNNVYGYIVIFVFLAHVFFILYSYVKLIIASSKSREDRGKFMQTCLPHLLTLINFTVALFFDTMYSRYGTKDFPQSLRNFLALEFLIIPPLFNPLVYGLKLTQVRRAVLRMFNKHNSADILLEGNNKHHATILSNPKR